MKKYYFLACSLPILSLKDQLAISFNEFNNMLDLNVSSSDGQMVREIKLFIDIQNLRLFWLNKPIDSRGNLSKKELESALLVEDFFPDFLFTFLQRHEDIEYRLAHFPYLIARFFQEEKNHHNHFLRSYFSLERDIRLILTALRSKQLDRDLVFEVQYEDFQDNLVAYILAQKDSESFEPPQEYQRLKDIFQKYYQEPLQLQRKLIEYKISQMDEIVVSKSFTIDEMLAYMVKLMLIEDWYSLDPQKGAKTVEALVG